MAETLVNLLIERLASVTIDKITRELNLVMEVDDEVANLNRNLKRIGAVLQDAEDRRGTDASVQVWLNELNQLFHEMEDVLDEWNTEIIKQQLFLVEQAESEPATPSKKGKLQVCFPCFSFGQVRHQFNLVIHRRDIGMNIQSLNQRLDQIAKESQTFNFQERKTASPEQPTRLPTSSLVDCDVVFGRDAEVNIVVKKLLDESSSSQRTRGPLVTPIVGMGGIGKTTLSQLVYNHHRVKECFGEMRIWVCVSDPFEVISIAKAIIGSLDRRGSILFNELDPLLREIERLITGKKFLLVLDDVWNPTYGQWQELIKPFLSCAQGSQLLVTTRKMDAVDVMGAAKHNMITMDKLSETCTRSLFKHFAFLGREEDIEKFEDVSKEFVSRCNGLPLAAKSLGSLMNHKKTLKEWEYVLNSPIWDLKGFADEVFRPLLLSYYDLSPTLRRCLLYCVIFPKDYAIYKDDLIELWMSQDYLYQMATKRDEKIIGQIYFEDLVMRSFFQDFQRNEDGEIIECKMHDLIHDLLQYLTQKEFYTMEGLGAHESISGGVRHLTLMCAPNCLFSNSSANCGNLRTFATFSSKINIILPKFVTLQLKCVRTLNLSHNLLTEVPKEIGELIHLRYLDLSYNRNLKELPDTMRGLYNLRNLRINGCVLLLNVPAIINLKYLSIKYCKCLKGIGGLRSLQTLKPELEGYMLEELENLDSLHGSLIIRNLGAEYMEPNGIEKAQLKKKRFLLHLELLFDGFSHEEKQTRVLNALEPHPLLESLSIIACSTTSTPSWLMDLHHLKSLTLNTSTTELPPLGILSSLESLRIEFMDKVKKVGVEFLGIASPSPLPSSSSSAPSFFPKLKHLAFDCLSLWKEWEGVDDFQNITIMPCLSSLQLKYCRELKNLPDFLWEKPIQKLVFIDYHGEKPAPTKLSRIPNIHISVITEMLPSTTTSRDSGS